ncbi:MAG: CoB--CoM heterodisulfide reductase iron-sulfur subunit A family protein [Anaerolineae bacterium]|nr:CoB--CoM heterodisulfide reductase iron-sulfur subunit A family protein [Anaerolineae bacterium]MCZ7553147.1 CoB--CoM heterodisulfide reductase iron-sulfur subunit A family protein [Anaerolineales bacterium]
MEDKHVDALVVGGGIAGMQTALDLADQGNKVILIERDPSIGGKMITLSKVFPTLDCCSCITTPKMSAVAHHPNIELLTYCEVQTVTENNGGFAVNALKKPRYVNEKSCTGCRQCEFECPVTVPSHYDRNLGSFHAIRVPFSTAVPQTAVLDMEYCLLCGKCEKACPVDAVDFTQKPESFDIHTRSIILATGFEMTSLEAKKEYGRGKLKNVIDPLMMERFLAPTGPYGRVLRPGDGKEPTSIAYVQCAGSRDETLGVDYCSRICCMYAIKQAMLLNGALPLADITIYYMDIRTFGKGYEQFYQNAQAMGIEFVRGKVAKISEDEERNPVLRVEMTETGEVVERTHDLVVLSLGMIPGYDPNPVYHVALGKDQFVHVPSPNSQPCVTDRPGVFVTGTAMEPMDIVDSIITAGAAAVTASAYLREQTNGAGEYTEVSSESEVVYA